MPILFIIALVVFVIAVMALPFTASRDLETRADAIGVAIIVAVIGGLFTIGASANTVPVRNVGIVTSFNKPTGETTGSGLHWVAPWKKIGEWDSSRQKYDHIGAKKAVTVRTATLANAGVELLIEWRTIAKNAPQQFTDYKGDFRLFREQRVGVQLDGAVNDAFATYSPLANIDEKGNLNVDLKPFSDRVRGFATERLAEDVEILSVTVVRVNHDEQTEANIKTFQDRIAQGRILDQDQVNAEKQKRVTETNASVNQVTRCLEIAASNGSNPGWCLNPGISTGTK